LSIYIIIWAKLPRTYALATKNKALRLLLLLFEKPLSRFATRSAVSEAMRLPYSYNIVITLLMRKSCSLWVKFCTLQIYHL